MYPGQRGQNDQQDAARHMLAAGTMARKYGPRVAELAGKAHEYVESPLKAMMMMLGRGQMPADYEQDLHNNALGIEMANRAQSQRDLEDLIQSMAERSATSQTQGRPWVNKAKGGAVTAPRSADMAEENRPFIGYRSAGRRPESQQDRRAAADAPLSALRGAVSGVLGAPGDIESLIRMLPGLSEQTVLPTSEDVEKRLPMRELNQTPTGKAFTTAGQLGGGFYTGPGSPLRAVAALPSAVSRAGRDFLMSGSPVNVVKPKGGNWLAGSVDRAIEPMRAPVRSQEFLTRIADEEARGLTQPGMLESVLQQNSKAEAMNRWLETKLAKYMRNDMATPGDPLRALAERGIMHSEIQPTGYNVARARREAGFPEEGMGVSPMAKTWEDRADTFINELEAFDLTSAYPEVVKDNSWLLKVPPETRVYDMLRGADEDLGFAHLTDELRNAINPESGLPENLRWKYSDLEQVTVPQAVERVAKINDWRAAQKAEADMARAMNPATQVVKEYPEQGYKWVELRQPEMKEMPSGYSVKPMDKDGWFAVYGPDGRSTGAVGKSPDEAIANQEFGRQSLEDALKYEGETMGHCVGGYCPDVVEGRSRIYSLRDKKGQPHVTIEVQPGLKIDRSPDDLASWLNTPEGSALLKKNPQAIEEFMIGNDEPLKAAAPDLFAQPPEIVQIKGKGNKAPKEDYLPAVQDFVRSGNFGKVGDLQNAGLIDIQDPNAVLRALGKVSPERNIQTAIDNFNTAVDSAPNAQRYMSLDEMRDFLGGTPPEGLSHGGQVRGYQAGGAVKTAKATAKNIGELVEKYTPEFKQWFAGSKAATPEGEPLTVYRGTTKDEGDIIKKGWFTKDPNVASMFSSKTTRVENIPNSVVTPAHLKMKRPLVIEANGAPWDRVPFGDPRDNMFMSSDKIADFARDEKYDGVIFKNIDESDDFFDLEPTDVFVTFEPNQAKSIFNKKPTSDPRVGFAEGGAVEAGEADVSPFETYKFAHRQATEGNDMSMMGFGAGANVGGGRLDAALEFMRLQRDKEFFPQDAQNRTARMSYSKQIGDIGLNATALAPLDAKDVYIGMINGSIPLGLGRLLLGVQAQKTPFGSDVSGISAGYSGKVGPGNLNANVFRNKQGNTSGNVEYRVPFAEGGQVSGANFPTDDFDPDRIDAIVGELHAMNAA
jgi:hypothetical protein